MISSINGIRDGDLYQFQVFAGRAQVMSGIVSGNELRTICDANIGNPRFSFRAVCVREDVE